MSTVAAYREGWHVDGDEHILAADEPAGGGRDLVHCGRARAALAVARAMSEASPPGEARERAANTTVDGGTLVSAEAEPTLAS